MGQRVPDSARVVGETLKNFRQTAGLSLKDISAVLGVSYQQVQKYEQGHNRFPVEQLFKLKNFYGVAYEDFFVGLSEKDENQTTSEDRDLLFFYVQTRNLKNEKLKRQIKDIMSILLR